MTLSETLHGSHSWTVPGVLWHTWSRYSTFRQVTVPKMFIGCWKQHRINIAFSIQIKRPARILLPVIVDICNASVWCCVLTEYQKKSTSVDIVGAAAQGDSFTWLVVKCQSQHSIVYIVVQMFSDYFVILKRYFKLVLLILNQSNASLYHSFFPNAALQPVRPFIDVAVNEPLRVCPNKWRSHAGSARMSHRWRYTICWMTLQTA